jgi:hypothetical protein
MHLTPRLPLLPAALSLAALTLASPRARADVKQACVDASTSGQSLRDAAKLTEARAQFVECARDACPSIVRKACADWLADVDHRTPSVVFRAQLGDGTDAVDARVSLDGAPLARGLGGAAMPIDPGEHVVRFERAGAAAVEEKVVIVEGDRGRVITGRFASPAPAATPPAAPSPDTAPPPPASGLHVTPLSIALYSVGAVGVASFAIFGVTATSNLNNLRQTCAPYCSDSQLSSVKTEALVADISLGVGIVAVAAATYVLFTHKEPPAAAALLDVHAEPHGGFAAIGARF